MKKSFFTVSIILVSVLTAMAQTKTQEDKAFAVPDHIIIGSRFFIDLGAKNRVTVDLSDISDLDRIMNVDSVLGMYLHDIAALKDSLTDPLAAKKVDYVIDAEGRKKIRLQVYPQNGDSYLINRGELSALKISQDTINIIGVIRNPSRPKQNKVSLKNERYFHLQFILNNLDDLLQYMNGRLREKFAEIDKYGNGKWPLVKGGSNHYLAKDASITAERARGNTSSGGTGDMLELQAFVNVQNYKSYFVPSFSTGVKLVLSNHERTFKWEPGLFWEPHFLFAKDAQGHLRTYRNDFLTLTYGQGGITDHDPRKDFSFSAVFSVGYLIHRSGDMIDRNTFRIGAGKLKFVKTTIEPSIYFNNLFKGVTPGIRITQSF